MSLYPKTNFYSLLHLSLVIIIIIIITVISFIIIIYSMNFKHKDNKLINIHSFNWYIMILCSALVKCNQCVKLHNKLISNWMVCDGRTTKMTNQTAFSDEINCTSFRNEKCSEQTEGKTTTKTQKTFCGFILICNSYVIAFLYQKITRLKKNTRLNLLN